MAPNKTAIPMIRMALAGLDRDPPNVDLARGVLRELAGASAEPPPTPSTTPELRAVSITVAARELGYSAKHLRHLIKSGRLEGATIGNGRGTRVIVARAIEILGERKKAPPREIDAEESEALAWARRGGLRVVNGNNGGAS